MLVSQSVSSEAIRGAREDLNKVLLSHPEAVTELGQVVTARFAVMSDVSPSIRTVYTVEKAAHEELPDRVRVNVGSSVEYHETQYELNEDGVAVKEKTGIADFETAAPHETWVDNPTQLTGDYHLGKTIGGLIAKLESADPVI